MFVGDPALLGEFKAPVPKAPNAPDSSALIVGVLVVAAGLGGLILWRARSSPSPLATHPLISSEST